MRRNLLTTLDHFQGSGQFFTVVLLLAIVSNVFTLPVQTYGTVILWHIWDVPSHSEGEVMLLLRTAFETVLVTCVSVAIAALVAARWSTLFPAIAVDRFLSFRQAWRMSQGNGLRLWAIIFLVTMPVYLIFVPIIGGVGFENYLAITILKSVLFIVITATGTSALSAAYRPAFEGDSPAIAVFD